MFSGQQFGAGGMERNYYGTLVHLNLAKQM